MTARLAAAGNNTTSRATEGSRRANKPLMEKRRRARINQSLAVLKSLILDSARLENTKHSKLEKADILELTVRHLQRQRALGPGTLSKYHAGFAECMREVGRFLEVEAATTAPEEAPSLKARLLRHLQSCAADLEAEDAHGSPLTSATTNAVVKTETEEGVVAREDVMVVSSVGGVDVRPDSVPGDENNNAEGKTQTSVVAAGGGGGGVGGGGGGDSSLLSVVQVVPSRLPDGQLVFLLPSHYVQLAAWARASSLPALPAALPSSSSVSPPPPPHSPRCRPSVGGEELLEDDDEDDDEDEPLDCSRPRGVGGGGEDDDLDNDDTGPVWRPWDNS